MSLVSVERVGPVVTMSLNRPDARNALSIDLCNDIVDALDEIDRNPEARTIVVRGEGKAFCAGADLSAVSGPDALSFLPAFERMLEAVTRHRLPTVASIHGAALGGGLQLAMTCDFRIATENASLGIPSSKIGIVVNFENIQRLVLLVGPVIAKEVMLTGRAFSGAEAANVGLINQSVVESRLYDATISLASEISDLAPSSVQGAKRAIQVVLDHLGGARRTFPDEVAKLDEAVAAAYGSEDLAEGLRALTERRPPRFRGS